MKVAVSPRIRARLRRDSDARCLAAVRCNRTVLDCHYSFSLLDRCNRDRTLAMRVDERSGFLREALSGPYSHFHAAFRVYKVAKPVEVSAERSISSLAMPEGLHSVASSCGVATCLHAARMPPESVLLAAFHRWASGKPHRGTLHGSF